MSGLEVPGFIIGVAGLFSSCVDAFAYFKLSQRASKEVEVVLLKLDIEKTRLLIWADNIGIFSAISRNSRLQDEKVAELVKRILSQIETLLTDSEKLRTLYGVRTLENNPLSKAVDYVSSKSLATFRTVASRFWTRNMSRLISPAPESKLIKIRWAIYEREKFQALINDLSQLVDSLYELVNVAREVQDRIIIEDIESILDISRLNIIKEATEDSYRLYSEAAASVKALTEAGTIDRRNLGEYLRDMDGDGEGMSLIGSSSRSDLDLLWTEVKQTINCVVLTSGCRKVHGADPCDMRRIGSQVADDLIEGLRELPFDLSSRNTRGRRSLGQLVTRLIDLRAHVTQELVSGGFDALMKDEGSLTAVQQEALHHKFPFMIAYVYCAPCVHLLHTAIGICRSLGSRFTTTYIRPDDRLVSSCCASADRGLGLASIIEWLREWEATALPSDINYFSSFLDNVGIDHRLEHLDYEVEYDYTERENANVRVIVLGEVDYLTPLVQKAPGRITQGDRDLELQTRAVAFPKVF